MKMLSKSNSLFLFCLVANKSENHWRKLAHCTLQRHKMAAVKFQTCLVPAFILKYHKIPLMSHFDKTVMNIGYYYHHGLPTDTWIKSLNIVGMKDN